jgi:hypothetical protein
MKKCAYCGKDYPDDATVCAIDQTPLTAAGQTPSAAAAPKTSAPPAVKPALMTQLRTWHLYLGCIFAPMLLLFAITGIWQTIGFRGAGWMSALSSIHTSHSMKNGSGLSSPLLRLFVVLMALAFIITTLLGILMAVKQGKNRRVAYVCLGLGIAVPTGLVLMHVLLK